jgi:hypothetical protein
MIDVLDGVRDHYRATGLTERLKAALAVFGSEEQRLTPQQLMHDPIELHQVPVTPAQAGVQGQPFVACPGSPLSRGRRVYLIGSSARPVSHPRVVWDRYAVPDQTALRSPSPKPSPINSALSELMKSSFPRIQRKRRAVAI